MTKQDTLPGLQSPLEEGEPVFILRGRDSMAAHFAALWAALAAGDTANALNIVADLNSGMAYDYRNEPRTADKINSASDKALEINDWRKSKELKYSKNLNVTRI